MLLLAALSVLLLRSWLGGVAAPCTWGGRQEGRRALVALEEARIYRPPHNHDALLHGLKAAETPSRPGPDAQQKRGALGGPELFSGVMDAG